MAPGMGVSGFVNQELITMLGTDWDSVSASIDMARTPVYAVAVDEPNQIIILHSSDYLPKNYSEMTSDQWAAYMESASGFINLSGYVSGTNEYEASGWCSSMTEPSGDYLELTPLSGVYIPVKDISHVT